MRRVVIASDVSQELKNLCLYYGTTNYHQDQGPIKEWEKHTKERDPSIYHQYEKALSEGIIHWAIGTRNMPGTFSRNAWRNGARGNSAQKTEVCWRLSITTPEDRAELQRASLHGRTRYLWSRHNNKFNEWELGFVKSVGKQLADKKKLTGPQVDSLDKLFKKYKIPENAMASTEIGA